MYFLFGSVIGSFVQCLADRYPRYSRPFFSQCDFCSHRLYLPDLVPVLSWILHRGRCRWCGSQLSMKYLFSETLFGFVYLFLHRYSLSPFMKVQLGIILPVFYLAVFCDIRKGEIPDLCWIVLLTFAILFKQDLYLNGMLTVLAAGTLMSLLSWVGFGDVKMTAVWTLMYGKSTLLALSAACFLCLFAYLFRNKRNTSEIRFAPFLCSGFLISLFLLSRGFIL